MRGLLTTLLTGSMVAFAGTHATDKITKGEVEETVKQVILESPELIIQSLQRYEMKQQEMATQKSVKLANDYKAQLFANPTDPFVGDPQAKTIIVEFLDYQCGYCKRMNPILKQYLKQHPNGVKVVYKIIPLLGERSKKASVVAFASNQKGQFAQMHDQLMTKARLTDDDVTKAEKELNISDEQKKMAELQIIQNTTLADNLEVEATPTFYIMQPGGQIKVIMGYVPFEKFEKIIDG